MVIDVKNAIAYIRVSTDEQVEGFSLSTQELKSHELCDSNKINLIQIFADEGKSAKTIDRKGLRQMLDFVQKNSRKIDALIVYSVNRLSRNQKDYFYIKRILDRLDIKILSITEPSINEGGLAGRFVETFSSLTAELDNLDKSIKTKSNMEALLLTGISPWCLPVGYIPTQNKRFGEKKRNPENIDPIRFPIIQKGLKEFSQGKHTTTSLTLQFQQQGLTTREGKKVCRQLVDKILTRPAYAGYIKNPWNNNELVKGRQQAAITLEEFERIQLIKNGKIVTPKNRKRINETFPLRGFIKCVCCKGGMTASNARGNGGKYPYYRCKEKACELSSKSIRGEIVEKSYLTLLARTSPTDTHLKLFKAIALDVWDTRRKEYLQEFEIYKKQADELSKKLTHLIDMKYGGLLTEEDFLEQKNIISEQKVLVKNKLKEKPLEDWDINKAISEAAASFTDLRALWEGYDVQEKHRFQMMVFPDGILYDLKSGLLEPTLSPVFQVLNTIKRTHRDDASLLVTQRCRWSNISARWTLRNWGLCGAISSQRSRSSRYVPAIRERRARVASCPRHELRPNLRGA